MLKKGILIIVVSVLALTGLFLFGCQGSADSQTNQGLWVTGQGKVEVTPDIANVQLGIEAQSGTVAEAQAQANNAMTAVMSALKSNGIADADIQTRYFNIQKVTRWDADKQQEITIGYQVSNVVVAKVRNVQTTGSVIDAAVQAGGDLTRVDSVSFDVEDPIRYYDQAREKAMADAADKAKSLAKLAGVKLGKAIYINESSTTPVPPVPIYSGSEAAGAAVDTTQISAGQIEITLNVQVVYEIR
jgi:uncharacterized protein YggE